MFSGYSTKLWQHFEEPKHVGLLPAGDDIGTASLGSRHQGDLINIQIRVEQDDRIVDAKFKAYGSGPCIALCSYAMTYIIGKSIEDARKLDAYTLKMALEIPDIKMHCAMLIEDTIKAAIDDYLMR